MNAHLLSCECGEQLTVKTSDAGREVVCKCGAKLTVPAFRDIKQLPLADTPQASGPDWSPEQGIVFAVGIAIIMCAAGFAGLQAWRWSQLDTTSTADAERELSDRIIDTLTYEQAYLAWTLLRETGLGERIPPDYVVNQSEAERLERRMLYGAGAAAIGAVVCASALFLKRRSSPQRKAIQRN